MALPYLRSNKYGDSMESFMCELHKVEYNRGLIAYNAASEEERKHLDYQPTPPQEKWDEIYDSLSQYHIYLEKEYGGATGSMYSLEVSNHPIDPRGNFRNEYTKDYGPITAFLDAFYGLKGRRLSRPHIWYRYHGLAKVEYYSPAELAEKLTQLSRELLYKYNIAEYLDDPTRNIECYEIDFEWNSIDVLLHCKNTQEDYEFFSSNPLVITA